MAGTNRLGRRLGAPSLLVLCLLAASVGVSDAGADAAGSAAASGAAGSGAGSPGGSDPTDFVPETPPTYKGNNVTVDEKIGGAVPLDVTFRDHTGKLVRLRDVLQGELPTILTFNYSDCPMLCSLQLNGLTASLDELAKPTEITADSELVEAGRKAVVQLGAQFRVVTIVLEPSQSLAKTQATRDGYLQKLPAAFRQLGSTGWTFLSAATPKDTRAIAAVADSVGFRYTYIPERAEWAHPAALIFLSSAGRVTRYVYGTQFEASVMRESIVKAGLSEPSTAYGFMNRCYHWDPDANSHARAGMLALRIGALLFLGFMISAFVVRWLVRRRPRGPGVIQA
jgi:protein SCO1